MITKMTETTVGEGVITIETPPSVADVARGLRAELLEIENRVRAIKQHQMFVDPVCESYRGQHGEMIAQSMLALRAVEEARMRLGKVLQYGRDGVSIYDRKEAPSARPQTDRQALDVAGSPALR